METNKRHGGPYDRGSADRYYGRMYNPHYFVGDTNKSELVPREKMTPREIMEYNLGWDEEDDRKDWGN